MDNDNAARAHQVVAIADDLTGALEVGAKFAEQGLAARVVTDLESVCRARDPVLVIDIETRHVAATEAASRTRAAAVFARDQAARLIYKKTDSTLRGNIAAELRGLQAVFPEQQLVYAPAYPEMGRTVKEGELYVHGRPVHQTEFAEDRWNPVRDSNIRTVLEDVRALIVDGECHADIEQVATMILTQPPPRICAGPAALAGALARGIGTATLRTTAIPPVSRCLVVNGSLHPASMRQMAVAEAQGLFDSSWEPLDEHVDGSGRERAMQIGACVRRRLEAERFDALVVFGGDTAFGIHRALGSIAFEAIGEIASGVAACRSGDLLWITKAGGFGPPDILSAIRTRLT